MQKTNVSHIDASLVKFVKFWKSFVCEKSFLYKILGKAVAHSLLKMRKQPCTVPKTLNTVNGITFINNALKSSKSTSEVLEPMATLRLM